MRSIVGAALLLFGMSSVASAQQVIWKCRDPKGAESFQNWPCRGDKREVDARYYENARSSGSDAVCRRGARRNGPSKRGLTPAGVFGASVCAAECPAAQAGRVCFGPS